MMAEWKAGPVFRATMEYTVVPTLLRAGKTRANAIATDGGLQSFHETMIEVLERAVAEDMKRTDRKPSAAAEG